MENYIPSFKPKKCCVPNCTNKYSRRHRFPKNEPELFKKWLDIIKPGKYDQLSVQEIYNRYFVCDDHFSADCFVPGTRRGLKRYALPTVSIPGFDSGESVPKQQRCFEDFGDDASVSYTSIAPSCVSKDIASSASGPSTSKDFMDIGDMTSSIFEVVESPDIQDVSEVKSTGTRRVIHQRKSILKEVNIIRSSQLTPKAKIFYKTLKRWRGTMASMQKNIKSYRERLTLAHKVDRSQHFQELLKSVNSPTYQFVMCQIRNQHLKSYARRYTLDEKILALSLFKSSGKGYRLLSKIFALPSSRTLSTLLQCVPFFPGINKQIFENLRLNLENITKEEDKVCILLFDEIILQSSLKYNRKSDQIIGLEDYGTERRALLADHANVFMLKGVHRQWKQPIAFTFSKGPVKSLKLKEMLKKLILECQNIGLEVIATVCDQGTTNQTCINMLQNEAKEECLKRNVESNYFGFAINEREIVPLFDIPHLFKGLRNNLLNKNLHFRINGQEKIAKWVHLDQFYRLDTSDPTLRICTKLTDSHIIPSKMNKMKVKNCTQVFSHTVGSLMKRIAQWDIKDKYNLPNEAKDTADLILLLDQLFDSVNVMRISKPQAKPLKWPVTRTSNHRQFWRDSLEVLETMQFFSLQKQKMVTVPTLKKLKFTLRGFVYLVSILLEEKQFKFVLTGAFNQDSLENFFSYIRSHGVRNINPDISHFTSSFKALVINNFMSSHSPSSNCQKDVITECLDNLRSFLTGEFVAGVHPLDDTPDIPTVPPGVSVQSKTKLARCTLVYMTGAIYRILIKCKIIKNCENCRTNLSVRHGVVMDDDFIEARQYQRGHLLKPGQYLTFLLTHSLNSLFYLIPRLCTISSISKVLEGILQKELNFKVINCPSHRLGEKLCEIIVRCAIYWWCKQVNKIIDGSDTKFSKFLSRHPDQKNIDPVKLQAHEKYKTSRKTKKFKR